MRGNRMTPRIRGDRSGKSPGFAWEHFKTRRVFAASGGKVDADLLRFTVLPCSAFSGWGAFSL
jgi:hypothetical protein